MTITVYGGWLTVFGDDGIHRPILNINTPSSRFSRARFIKSTSKIAERILKNIGDVTIEVEENVRGDIMFFCNLKTRLSCHAITPGLVIFNK